MIRLVDHREPDNYEPIPVQKQIWHGILLSQLVKDATLRIPVPVLDGPLTSSNLEDFFRTGAFIYVVTRPSTNGPEPIGIAGILPKGLKDVYTPVFASINLNDETERDVALSDAYKELSRVVVEEIGDDGVVAYAFPGSVHVRALENAGYNNIATLPAVHRNKKKRLDVAWYVNHGA